jgi:hypothetical protein
LVYDTSTVATRNIDVKKYAADKNFEYTEMSAPKENYWDRFWKWFWQMVNDIFSSKAGNRVLNWSLSIIAIAVIVFFILKVTGMNHNGLFSKNDNTGINYIVDNDDINGIDFNAAIDTAITKNNYRLAIRLLYLQTLKLLSDKAVIDWRINKTNAAYVHELQPYGYQNEFMQLTFYFDKVWYGETKVDKDQFTALQQSFYQFQQAIKL